MAFSHYADYEKNELPASSLARKKIKNLPSTFGLMQPCSVANVVVFALDRKFKIKNFSATAPFWLQDYLKKTKIFFNKNLLGKSINTILQPFPRFLRTALQNALEGNTWCSGPIFHKNGTNQYWFQWEVFPYLEKVNEITGAMICVRDMTQHHQLLLSYKNLQCSHELLEGCNPIMAHDLIQPLRQISNFLSIIQENKHESLSDVFCALEKSIAYVQSLSEGITLYCKQGNLVVAPEKISVKSLVQNICANSLTTEKFQLHCNVKEDVFVYANRTCMTQLFQNLLANAIKHGTCEKGIITLSSVRENKNFYKFFLHNNGNFSGCINSENVFLPFESFASEGAGLGLMICKKIISAYKGKIFFCSEKNKGVTVCFTLPAYNVKEGSQKNTKNADAIKHMFH